MPSKKHMTMKKEGKLLSDPEFWDKIFKVISAGESTKSVSRHFDMPYNKMLSYIKADMGLSQRYEDARSARAMFHAERIEKIANDVEVGDLDANAARVSLDARKFLASRLDPHIWGDKQRVDITTTDVTKLHLEAIRELGLNENVIEHEGPALVES
jgi:hypothetical protein